MEYDFKTLHTMLMDLEQDSVIPIEKLVILPDVALLKRSVHKIHATQSEHRDRVKDVYEGGLKTWECSIDLVQYLHKAPQSAALPSPLHRILELGCGSGLPGIYCQQKFTHATVDYQDFNASVLALVTLPNVALNGQQEPSTPTVPISDLLQVHATESMFSRSRFYAGSWSNLLTCSSKTPLGDYDLILSSETLYDASNYASLLALLTTWLKRPTGKAFLATKSYYFGLDGGSAVFEQFLLDAQAPFHASIIPFHTQGVRRDIIVLEWK